MIFLNEVNCYDMAPCCLHQSVCDESGLENNGKEKKKKVILYN
jgi:hypothetical protein